MNQLPKGGGTQQPVTPTAQTQSIGRIVNRARLEKMNDEMLARKVGAIKSKIARKEELAQKKIAAIKLQVADYARFKEEESKVAREIMETRKRTTPLPAAPKDKAA